MQPSRMSLYLLLIALSLGVTPTVQSMKRTHPQAFENDPENNADSLTINVSYPETKQFRYNFTQSERLLTHQILGFSPQGELLLTTYTNQKNINVLDTKTGASVFTLEEPSDLLHAVISSDNTKILSTWQDGTCILSTIATQQSKRFTLPGSHTISTIAVSAQGTYALFCLESPTSGENKLFLWKTDKDEITQLAGYDKRVYSGTFSPNEKKLAIGSQGVANIVDIQTNSFENSVSISHTREENPFVTTVAFNSKGNALLLGLSSGAFLVCDIQKEKELIIPTKPLLIKNIPFGSLIKSASLNFDGKRVLITAQKKDEISQYIIDLTTGKTLLKINDPCCYWAAINGEGSILFTSSKECTDIELVHIPSGRLLQRNKTLLRKEKDLPLILAALSLDRSRLITDDPESHATALVWDMKTGSLVQKLEIQGDCSAINPYDNDLSVLALSPDGKIALTGSKGGIVRLWDTTTGKILAFEVQGDTILAADFSPDGEMVSIGADTRETCIRNSRTGKLIRVLRGPDTSNGVSAVKFSPDSKILFTALNNGISYVWNFSEEKAPHLLKQQDRIVSLAISPNGKIAVTTFCTNTVCFWDFEKKELLKELRDINPLLVACNNDNVTFFVQRPNGTKYIYNLQTDVLREIDYGSYEASVAAFNAEGDSLITIDTQGKVYTSQ